MAELTEEQLETAAFAAFCRNMADYEFEDGALHLAFYSDEGVRDFWLNEARNWASDLHNAQPMEGVSQ